MRTLLKDRLRQDEEISRILTTMLKKMKLSKKDEKLIMAEAVSDILWLSKIMVMVPWKYSIVLGDEEVAKIIFFRDHDRLHIHDLYVTPKVRKQEIAKVLVVEALGDNRDIPTVVFHTRETNKPIHNLVQFFVRKFNIPDEGVKMETTSAFYVDGGKAVLYNVQNPAHFLTEEVDEPHKQVDERKMEVDHG